MKKRIHVNQHVIKRNRKHKENEPPLTAKTYKTNDYGFEVGNEHFKVIYRPQKPLPCGAVCWVETDDEIYILCKNGKKVKR